jgi:hypothetical protein
MTAPKETTPTADPDAGEVMRRLAEPFGAGEVKFKPQVVQGNRALALAYVDARTIQDRLDDVLGTINWQDEYECLPDGSVICRLKLRIGGEWITKMDVGSPSEQPDGGDRMKAAFSDSLKRAAVKFGVGRYLYKLTSNWVQYDPQKRQFAVKPSLPASALPRPQGGGNPPPAQKPAPAPARERCTQLQVDRINALLGDMRLTLEWMHDALMDRFGKQEAVELTSAEAAQVILGLEQELVRRQTEAARKGAAKGGDKPKAKSVKPGANGAAGSNGKDASPDEQNARKGW